MPISHTLEHEIYLVTRRLDDIQQYSVDYPDDIELFKQETKLLNLLNDLERLRSECTLYTEDQIMIAMSAIKARWGM